MEEFYVGFGFDGFDIKIIDKMDLVRVVFLEFMKLFVKLKYKVLEEMDKMSMELGDEFFDVFFYDGGKWLFYYCFWWVIWEVYDMEVLIFEDGIEKVMILEMKNVLYMFVDYFVMRFGMELNENGLKKFEMKFRFLVVMEYLNFFMGMYYDLICFWIFIGWDVGDLNFYVFLMNMCEDMEDEIWREYFWVEGWLENYEYFIGFDIIVVFFFDNIIKYMCGFVNIGDEIGVLD